MNTIVIFHCKIIYNFLFGPKIEFKGTFQKLATDFV